MAESKFMAFLKNIFGGGQQEPQQEPQHERYCLSCHKMTAGTIGPAAEMQSANACVLFTCGDCKHTTALLA